LKSPITGILGLTAVLLDDNTLTPRLREILEHIHDAGNRMHRLVVDLLDTAAGQMGKMNLFMQPTELRDILSGILARYITATEVKQQTFIFPQSEEYWVVGDVQRLSQVFDNIISNAVKYSPLGGTITITLWASADTVQVAVKDEGVGFTEEDKAKLFGFFQRLSAQPTGNEPSSGVGLAIVKQIVDIHKGRVWVESEYGHGSRFVVELPRENTATVLTNQSGAKQ
jgi:signal transduction histidine kinase